MSEKELSPNISQGSFPPPPKELPSFFTQHKRTTAIIPPVPPQLHPFIQPPSIAMSESIENSESPTVEVLPTTPSVTLSSAPISSFSPSVPFSSTPLTPEVTSQLSFPPCSTSPPLLVSHPSALSPSATVAESASPVNQNAGMNENATVNEIMTMPTLAAPSLQQTMIPIDVLDSGEGTLTKVNSVPEGGFGVFQWFQQTVKQSEFLSKVASKAKLGMDSVLTTLDPGMRVFLNGDDGFHVALLCANKHVIDAIRHGLRQVFNELTFGEMPVETGLSPEKQIIGHDLAWKKATEQLSNLRNSVGQEAAVIVVQPFLYQVNDCWFDSALLMAQKDNVEVSVFTQATQVDTEVITALQNTTPKEYSSGTFDTTVGYVYAQIYGGDPEDWQRDLLSFSSVELYRAASIALGTNLKRMLSMKSSKS